MTSEEQAQIFITVTGIIYNDFKKKMVGYCYNTNQPFDEDIFQDTILKCYNTIEKHGLKDLTEEGVKNYIFKSFKMNIVRETQYARNRLKDSNISSDELKDKYEEYKQSQPTLEQKEQDDLFQDYLIHYILNKVENNFNLIDYRLFTIKLFYQCTYKKLKSLTKISDVKKRITTINNWLKENITYKEIEQSFIDYQNNVC